MDTKETLVGYEAPRLVDYGSLQELTAACFGGRGGDAAKPNDPQCAEFLGTSAPQFGCTSN